MDMKRIIQTIDSASNKSEIINEGKGPLNRPTNAESITMKHYTTPVQRVIENVSPSMISKYVNAVEQELKEAAERPNDRATQLAKRIIERVTIGPDGKVTGGFKPQLSEPVPTVEPAPAPAPAPSNIKPSGSTVEYGGSTYSVNVFGDGMRPRIGRSDKVVTAKVYTLGDKMYVLLDPAAQEGIAEDSDPCWDSHKMVGTKKKGGKSVPNCVPKEAVNPAQQAAIAIAKKKAGKK
jgi:hypothetical protein